MPDTTGDPSHYGFETTIEQLLGELKEKYDKKGLQEAWTQEKGAWEEILHWLKEHRDGISFNYRTEHVLGVGGAGAVLRIVDCNLFSAIGETETPTIEERLQRSYRALKVPRPHVLNGEQLAASLRDEISRLVALSHPNVVGLFAKGQVTRSKGGGSVAWPWYIMEYIHGAKDLEDLCATATPPLPVLVKYIYEITKGLKYVHTNKVIHCDIKPSNIFVSSETATEPPRAVLADFGYAKHLTDILGETTVGFSEFFAHPDLTYGAQRTSQGSRTFNTLPRQTLRPAFDLFALGMTIHYLLEKYYATFANYQQHSYDIKYLKLCAARLLDGYNSKKSITYGNLPYYCFGDSGEIAQTGTSLGIKYRSIAETLYDLEKLIGVYAPETEVPELIDTRRENIQVSDMAPLIYTDRVRKVVEHPLLRRLASVTQLGVVSLVYPGATHSRLEHSLGTMGLSAKYIAALYHDALDPLFRQLIDGKSVKATLLAALMHDIAQYPLAHDLEDVSLDFFSHELFGSEMLSKQIVSPEQRPLFGSNKEALSSLVDNLDTILTHDWDVSIDDILRIHAAKNSDEKPKSGNIGSYIDRLCKSLIDGPIDADKVDYLQRDSRHCNVQYGYGIDTARLLKCLTVVHNSLADDQLLLVVGVHEKGRISAESILFARYAMLTQVYWHHTMRAIKALIHLAAAEMLDQWSDTNMALKREEFFRVAVLGEDMHDTSWEELISTSTATAIVHSGDLRVLGWIWRNGSSLSRECINNLLNRKLFKRVAHIFRSELTDTRRRKLEKVYLPGRFKDMVKLRHSIERALYLTLRGKESPSALVETSGFSASQWKSRMEDSALFRCLIDYPAPRSGASFGLYVVRQWGERPKEGPLTRPAPKQSFAKIIPGENFRDGMKELEKQIACLRVYWRPDEYLILKEMVGEEKVLEIVMEELDKFKPSEE